MIQYSQCRANVSHHDQLSLALADRIDRLNAAIGRTAAWACLFVVLVQFAVVVLRYAFGIGSIWLTGIDHLRPRRAVHAGGGLDAARGRPCAGRCVLRRRLAAHQGADRPAGALLLLLPFMLVLAWFALPYVARSWAILERSRETSGLPVVFLLKTLIPLFALLMALQGVSQAIRAAHVLRPPHGR